MAGFEEFMNYPKDLKNNKVQYGLDGILQRINETIEQQAQKVVQREPEAPPKEEAMQKKASSDDIIMHRGASAKSSTPSSNSSGNKEIFNFDISQENVVQGFIFSEILGKPKSRRRRAR